LFKLRIELFRGDWSDGPQVSIRMGVFRVDPTEKKYLYREVSQGGHERNEAATQRSIQLKGALL
jgi:hypothetical protein